MEVVVNISSVFVLFSIFQNKQLFCNLKKENLKRRVKREG